MKNKNSTFLDTNKSSSYLKLGTKFILSIADSLTPPVTRAQNSTYPETKAESLTQPVTVADNTYIYRSSPTYKWC